MRYVVRKQTKADFTARVMRLDPGTAHRSAFTCRTARRPVFRTLTGFACCSLVICIASRREPIHASLLQGPLPPQMHATILAALAALITVSVVMLISHLLRCVTHRGASQANSANLLLGALSALALLNAPSGMIATGHEMLDANSRSILAAAHATVTQTLRDAVPDVDWAGVDWAGVVLIASNGK